MLRSGATASAGLPGLLRLFGPQSWLSPAASHAGGCAPAANGTADGLFALRRAAELPHAPERGIFALSRLKADHAQHGRIPSEQCPRFPQPFDELGWPTLKGRSNMNARRYILVIAAACLNFTIAGQASAYHAAHMGRFTSRDPAGELGRMGIGIPPDPGTAMGLIERDEYDPMAGYKDGMNLYQYAKSAPTVNTDPSGLETPSQWSFQYRDKPRPPKEPGPNLYCYYITPGNSAPVDPWYLNWGSETGIVVGGAAGAAAAAGPTVTVGTGGCFRIWCTRIGAGIRRDPAHHGKPHGHWHFPWNW